MNSEILAGLDFFERDKGIKREVLLEAINNAVLAAARKAVGPAKDLRVEIDPKSGDMKVYAKITVVEKVQNKHDEISFALAKKFKSDVQLGEDLEVPVTPRDFGRIAAQTAKQAMMQRIRQAEKEMIYDEFKDRAGEIVSGTVRRFERLDVVVDLGKFEALMPNKERVQTEDYNVGDRIRAYVVAVQNGARGPEIIISRSHPNFVRRLFETEVSEIADHTVEIKGIAREAGYRTKIAVFSANDKVDPVGACVGMRGARVKNIVRELNNEKVDLFKWSPNIRELVIEALKPAKLKTLEVDEAGKKVTVLVDEENLSLAIGRRGQNARLTQKLTGWEIDVKKEEEVAVLGFEQKLAKASEALAQSLQIEAGVAEKIVRAGFLSAEGIAETELDDFTGAVAEAGVDAAVATSIH